MDVSGQSRSNTCVYLYASVPSYTYQRNQPYSAASVSFLLARIPLTRQRVSGTWYISRTYTPLSCIQVMSGKTVEMAGDSNGGGSCDAPAGHGATGKAFAGEGVGGSGSRKRAGGAAVG